MVDETTQAILDEFTKLADKLFADRKIRDERIAILDGLERRRLELCIQKLELEIKRLK